HRDHPHPHPFPTRRSSDLLTISADERSNTILLAGDPASRQRARQLVQQLDQPISTSAFTRVVFLHYLAADELIPVLKSTADSVQDRKSTRLNSSHVKISYA